MSRLLLICLLFITSQVFSQSRVEADQVREKKLEDEMKPCSQIDYSYDKFHYEKKYSTAIVLPESLANTSFDKFFNANIYKYIKNKVTTYYLSLSTVSSTPDITRKGVIIILKNGKRINKPLAKVETDVEMINNKAEFVVSSFITLTQNDINLLKSTPIKEFELYVSQASVVQPEFVYGMFLCLLDKK